MGLNIVKMYQKIPVLIIDLLIWFKKVMTRLFLIRVPSI